jgi:CRP/FNR family transcriptional regulator, cyclic AMP receptor protein
VGRQQCGQLEHALPHGELMIRSPYALELVEDCQTCPLRSKGFFCDVNAPVLKRFESILHTTAYPQGAVLFAEGDSSRGVFMLCQGRVKISMTSQEGKSVILRIAKPGDILGVTAAVSKRPFQETAETVEPCQVNFAGREDFVRFLREHSEASIHAAIQAGLDYQLACDQIRSLGFSLSAPERLARFLLDWTEMGKQSKEGIRADVPLTHEEIGQLIGTSRETVTRVLGDFRTKRLVSRRGSRLLIQNRSGLEDFAVSSRRRAAEGVAPL